MKMNSEITYYRKLSLLGLLVFVCLVFVQLFWLRKAVSFDRAEHRLRLKQAIPDMALEINALGHDLFHSQAGQLEKVELDSIAQIVRTHLSEQGLGTEVAFALYQDSVGGLFRSNRPELKQELLQSEIRTCMSCIISFSFLKPIEKLRSESDESYKQRLEENATFQYYSPVTDLVKKDRNTVYLSLYHPKTLLQSMGTLWYLFLGGFVLIIILLVLFYYLLRSLTSYKKLTQVKDDFFNNMTHEFKTPLSSIRLASRMLKDKPDLEHSRTYFNLIEKESKQLENQIDKLLELSLLDKHGLGMQMSETNVATIFEQVRKRMNPLIADKKATLLTEVKFDDDCLIGDHVHLVNSLSNLIENSLKHSGNGVMISMVMTSNGNEKVISIRDTGPGIELAHQSHIFERFYRIQNGNQYKSKGFGIGLSYVQSVIEAHNGRIEFNPDYRNGTEFLIYL